MPEEARRGGIEKILLEVNTRNRNVSYVCKEPQNPSYIRTYKGEERALALYAKNQNNQLSLLLSFHR